MLTLAKMIECPNRLNAVASSVAATSSTYKSEQIEERTPSQPGRTITAHTLYMALPRAQTHARVYVRCLVVHFHVCVRETVQKAQVYMCNMESRKYVRRVQLF